MKIIFLARRKRRTLTPTYMTRGLRALGHQVKKIHPARWEKLLGRPLADKLLLARVRALKPDAVLVWKDCVSGPLLAELSRQYKTVSYCVDYYVTPPESLVESARLVDLFLLTNRGQLELYRSLGAKRVGYLPQACGFGSHEPVDTGPPRFGGDVAFIGRPGNLKRQELLRQLDERFELKIWGPKWRRLADRYRHVQLRDAQPRDYSRICAASKVIVGCDYTTEVEMYFSNRTWLTLGCRGFLVTNYSPGIETLFENHKHLAWYTSPEECIELIHHYLNRQEERRQIAQAGYYLVANEHTYVHRARRLIDLVNGLPAKDVSSSG